MTMVVLRVPTYATVRLISTFVVASGILLSLAGCNERVVFHSFRHIPGQGWNNRDTLVFDIDTVRTDATYNFELELRSTHTYPYTDIMMAVERDFSPPGVVSRDTVTCRLTHPDIQRTGKGIYVYQYEVSVPPMALHRGQTGRIRVSHLMMREILPGIRDVGMLVSR